MSPLSRDEIRRRAEAEVVRTRAAIEAGPGLSFEAALDLERDYQRELGRSADYREGVTKRSMEKRAPRFTGQ